MNKNENYTSQVLILLAANKTKLVNAVKLETKLKITHRSAFQMNQLMIQLGWINMCKRDGDIFLKANDRTEQIAEWFVDVP